MNDNVKIENNRIKSVVLQTVEKEEVIEQKDAVLEFLTLFQLLEFLESFKIILTQMLKNATKTLTN